jgi:hypothetical protein
VGRDNAAGEALSIGLKPTRRLRPPSPAAWLKRGSPGAVALVLPLLGFLLFSSAGRDDSHITYWAADALSRVGEIVNYNGDRVEQSSSLLHTVVLAVLRLATGVPVPVIGFVFGIATGTLAAAAAAPAAALVSVRRRWLAAVLVATNPFAVYWAFGGLETGLAALLTVAFVTATSVYVSRGGGRAFAWAVTAVVAYVAVRPETGLIATAALLGLCAWTLVKTDLRRHFRRAATLAVTAAAAFGALVVWRLSYFDAPFPQPVLAKVGGLRPDEGLEYLQSTLGQPHALGLLLLAGVGAVTCMRRGNVAAALAAATAGAHVAFVALTGGDWMEGGRLVAPVVPVLAMLATATGWRRASVVLPAGVVGAQLMALVMFAGSASTGTPLWAQVAPPPRTSGPPAFHWFERHNRVHARDALFYADLKRAVQAVGHQTGRPVLIASGQAGMLMYTLSSDPDVPALRFIDAFGLTTRDLHACSSAGRSTALGTFIPYGRWLDDPRCAPDLPDLIFDRKLFAAWPGLHRDYVLVHQQTGVMRVVGSRLAGTEVSAEQFVAVRSDLSAALAK